MFAKTSSAAAATTFLLLCTTSAFAVDATAFADRLKAVVSKQNAEISYESAKAEGEDVVVTGIAVKQGPETHEIGDLTFETVTGSTADGWNVEHVSVPDYEQKQGPNTTTLKNMTVDGLQIAGTSAADQPAVKQFSELFFEKTAIGSVDVSRDGKPVFSVDDINVENTLADGGTLTSTFGVGGFDADLESGGEAKAAQTLRDIGYEKIAGTMNGTAVWDPQSGDLKLEPFDIKVDDAGSFSFTYGLSGYTPKFIESLQQVQAQMQTNPDNQQQAAMAMMGLISQLTLQSVDITFDDDSLTNKLLDYYAKQQNVSRDQLVDNLTGMMPMALSYLQNPDFQKQVADAVGTYLKDPESISISADPEGPIPATQLIGAAMSAPQTLPAVLSLRVAANGEEPAAATNGTDTDNSSAPASGGATDDTTPAEGTSGGDTSSGSAN